jgi:hypothetical protein
VLEGGVALGDSKLEFLLAFWGRWLIYCSSLAMAEMRCLLKGVYSRFRTMIAPNMKGRMTMSDQIVSSRPLDQTCKLVFEPRDEA